MGHRLWVCLAAANPNSQGHTRPSRCHSRNCRVPTLAGLDCLGSLQRWLDLRLLAGRIRLPK